MEKIQLKAFDGRRNQNFWFHFCYIADDLWKRYRDTFHVRNMDAQIKVWLEQDFDLEIECMEDVSKAKECIKKLYSEVYPEIYTPSDSDRQGWCRVWLTNKVTQLLGDCHE